MGTMRQAMDAIRDDLSWRVPLYLSFMFYLLTCRNFMDVIQYERNKSHFDHFEIRGGVVIRLKSVADAVIIMKDIWMHQVYTRHYKGHAPSIVVDVGANVGFFTLFAKKLWPSSRIYCYEPEPNNLELLRHNVLAGLVSNVTVCNQAATRRAGRQILFVSEASGWHSLLAAEGEDNKDTVEVPTIDLDGIIHNAGGYIDFMKIDCEGCEWDLLEGNEDLLRDHVSYVAMEYHEIPGRCRTNMLALFQRAGFDCWASPPDKWKSGMLYAAAPIGRDGRRSLR